MKNRNSFSCAINYCSTVHCSLPHGAAAAKASRGLVTSQGPGVHLTLGLTSRHCGKDCEISVTSRGKTS